MTGGGDGGEVADSSVHGVVSMSVVVSVKVGGNGGEDIAGDDPVIVRGVDDTGVG
jgi:hypothetical protein